MIHSSLFERTVRIAGLACSLDPVTLSAIAIGAIGAAGGAAVGSALTSNTPPPTAAQSATPEAPPPTPAAAAPPVNSPSGTKPKGQTNSPSFIGSAPVPSQVGYGSHTLLGQ